MRGPHVRFCERRGGVILRAYSTNPGVASRGPGLLRCARPEHTEKRKARFIQGDRLEDGAELAMTASWRIVLWQPHSSGRRHCGHNLAWVSIGQESDWVLSPQRSWASSRASSLS